LGKLVFQQDPAKAKPYFELALEQSPDYSLALQWLGRVAVAQGDMTTAQSQLEAAYALQPLAQIAIDLSDLAALTGDTSNAEKYASLTRLTFASTKAAGTDTALEEAQFLVPRGLAADEAIGLAELAYTTRPTIFSADIYALALVQQGSVNEAQAKSTEALRLGAYDPAIVYHAGLIAEAAGDLATAQDYYQTAYNLSPHFSLWEAPQLLNKIQFKQ
jgi:tetratricopeptide (TPR) repeat protein